jgi:hypothetical protein
MDAQALINYFAREGYWRHIQTACTEFLKKRAGDPVLLFWKAFGCIQEGSFSEALRELEPLQVSLASISTSLINHSTAVFIWVQLQITQLLAQLFQSPIALTVCHLLWPPVLLQGHILLQCLQFWLLTDHLF